PSITSFLADRSTRAAKETSNVSANHPARTWHHVPDAVAQLSDPETLPEPIESIPVINAIPSVNEYAAPVADHHVTSVEHVDAPVEVQLPPSSDSIIQGPANI